MVFVAVDVDVVVVVIEADAVPAGGDVGVDAVIEVDRCGAFVFVSLDGNVELVDAGLDVCTRPEFVISSVVDVIFSVDWFGMVSVEVPVIPPCDPVEVDLVVVVDVF